MFSISTGNEHRGFLKKKKYKFDVEYFSDMKNITDELERETVPCYETLICKIQNITRILHVIFFFHREPALVHVRINKDVKYKFDFFFFKKDIITNSITV